MGQPTLASSFEWFLFISLFAVFIAGFSKNQLLDFYRAEIIKNQYRKIENNILEKLFSMFKKKFNPC